MKNTEKVGQAGGGGGRWQERDWGRAQWAAQGPRSRLGASRRGHLGGRDGLWVSFLASAYVFGGLGAGYGVTRSSAELLPIPAPPLARKRLPAAVTTSPRRLPGKRSAGAGGSRAQLPSNRWCPPFRPHVRQLSSTLCSHREERLRRRVRSPGPTA